MPRNILLAGAPVDCGKKRQGCLMGPDALRTTNLAGVLTTLGHSVKDIGDLVADETDGPEMAGIFRLAETVGWTRALSRATVSLSQEGCPVFMGGDHALSLGTVLGAASFAAHAGRPQFVLWLDAHSDFNTLETTESGNLHGTPLAYVTGRAGFDPFPKVHHPIPEANVCIVGLRSVDGPERRAIEASDIARYDMRAIDERGVAAVIAPFLDRVRDAKGMLHVSLDVDFLDPSHAPAVGTTVPGGATVREAHLAMELIHDSGLMTSMDLVELNPMLDERGRTAQLMVDLCASAFGRRVFDRPTPRL